MTNRCKRNIFIYTAVLIVGISQMTFSNSNELIMLDDFDPSPKVEWNFVADSVMGGVSSGEVRLDNDGSEAFASMIGNVST
ncbi:MAG: CIA30 family protein, partial [Pseudomonadota bacterium]|nr:CIA30 family protein [Pseudomonadota bacterium]